MSGGHFDYAYHGMSEFADDLKQDIESNIVTYKFNDKTIALLTTSQQIIEVAGKLAREIEWLYSGDHGEGGFAELASEILTGRAK